MGTAVALPYRLATALLVSAMFVAAERRRGAPATPDIETTAYAGPSEPARRCGGDFRVRSRAPPGKRRSDGFGQV